MPFHLLLVNLSQALSSCSHLVTTVLKISETKNTKCDCTGKGHLHNNIIRVVCLTPIRIFLFLLYLYREFIIKGPRGFCIANLVFACPFQRGQDINTTLLTDQRDKTKNRSLRVVYFGNRDVYRQMQLELRHAAISGISWLVVDQSEDMTTPLDVTTDTLPVGTVVISQSSVVVAEVQQYVAEKWEKVLKMLVTLHISI